MCSPVGLGPSSIVYHCQKVTIAATAIAEKKTLRHLSKRVATRRQTKCDFKCSIPDDHIDPRRSALFMARSILREVREGVRAC
jgi:hypothetical protein